MRQRTGGVLLRFLFANNNSQSAVFDTNLTQKPTLSSSFCSLGLSKYSRSRLDRIETPMLPTRKLLVGMGHRDVGDDGNQDMLAVLSRGNDFDAPRTSEYLTLLRRPRPEDVRL